MSESRVVSTKCAICGEQIDAVRVSQEELIPLELLGKHKYQIGIQCKRCESYYCHPKHKKALGYKFLQVYTKGVCPSCGEVFDVQYDLLYAPVAEILTAVGVEWVDHRQERPRPLTQVKEKERGIEPGKQAKSKPNAKVAIGIGGLLALCVAMALAFFELPKYINEDMSSCWIPVVLSVGGIVAILIGVNVIKTEPIEALFRVEKKTYKDNIKQGLRAFGLGLPASVVGGIMAIALALSRGELDLGPFNTAVVLMPFFFLGLGLPMTYLSAKIWVITIRRYRARDESFNDQKWSGSEFLNDMISGKS